MKSRNHRILMSVYYKHICILSVIIIITGNKTWCFCFDLAPSGSDCGSLCPLQSTVSFIWLQHFLCNQNTCKSYFLLHSKAASIIMPRWAEPRGIQQFVCLFVCQSLCLGGRSHEAYCNRAVCLLRAFLVAH